MEKVENVTLKPVALEPAVANVLTGHFLKLLPERASKSDVHLLKSAADAKHWHTGGYRLGNQRQRGFVTMGVVQGTALARFTAIVARIDV